MNTWAIHAGDQFVGIVGFAWDRTKTGKIRFWSIATRDDVVSFGLYSESQVRQREKVEANMSGRVLCPALMETVNA